MEENDAAKILTRRTVDYGLVIYSESACTRLRLAEYMRLVGNSVSTPGCNYLFDLGSVVRLTFPL